MLARTFQGGGGALQPEPSDQHVLRWITQPGDRGLP